MLNKVFVFKLAVIADNSINHTHCTALKSAKEPSVLLVAIYLPRSGGLCLLETGGLLYKT